MANTPVIIVHGGAWSIPDDQKEASVRGCVNAVKCGSKILLEGGSSLDAVEAAVRVLEDDPVFDAGHGSVLNELGEVEMDAMIMDGSSLRCGAVACISDVANPVSVARAVMEKTHHTLLVGPGATSFAHKHFPVTPKEKLVTDDARAYYEKYRYQSAVSNFFNTTATPTESCGDGDGHGHEHGGVQGHDTVGCVAMDMQGNIACATSTGGITGKMAGRVGDSPLVGCGGYSDNHSGGASSTGHGESITKVVLCRRAVSNLERGLSVQNAAQEALDYMLQRVGGRGGLIMISPTGEVGYAFSTPRMAWASRVGTSDVQCGIDKDE